MRNDFGMPAGCRGFSLLEVLVTTVVFSIGMLGVAGLSAFSKRASFESVQRATAAQVAYGLLEEMRANSDALDVYAAAGELGRGSLSAPASACNSVATLCTAAEVANQALWRWERMLDTGMESRNGVGTGGLVSPTVCIAGPAGGAGVYSVTVVWRGTAEITDPGINACGNATGLYGADNAFRRMVVVQSYIDPSV